MTRTPQRPMPTAAQRRGPTRSPSSGTLSAVISRGEAKATAVASGKRDVAYRLDETTESGEEAEESHDMHAPAPGPERSTKTRTAHQQEGGAGHHDPPSA